MRAYGLSLRKNPLITGSSPACSGGAGPLPGSTSRDRRPNRDAAGLVVRTSCGRSSFPETLQRRRPVSARTRGVESVFGQVRHGAIAEIRRPCRSAQSSKRPPYRHSARTASVRRFRDSSRRRQRADHTPEGRDVLPCIANDRRLRHAPKVSRCTRSAGFASLPARGSASR